MKVKLLKPFCGRKVGSVITMHPINARRYYKEGVCEALPDASDTERAYLSAQVLNRGTVVETQVESRATETADKMPTAHMRKPRGTAKKRKKS